MSSIFTALQNSVCERATSLFDQFCSFFTQSPSSKEQEVDTEPLANAKVAEVPAKEATETQLRSEISDLKSSLLAIEDQQQQLNARLQRLEEEAASRKDRASDPSPDSSETVDAFTANDHKEEVLMEPKVKEAFSTLYNLIQRFVFHCTRLPASAPKDWPNPEVLKAGWNTWTDEVKYMWLRAYITSHIHDAYFQPNGLVEETRLTKNLAVASDRGESFLTSLQPALNPDDKADQFREKSSAIWEQARVCVTAILQSRTPYAWIRKYDGVVDSSSATKIEASLDGKAIDQSAKYEVEFTVFGEVVNREQGIERVASIRGAHVVARRAVSGA